MLGMRPWHNAPLHPEPTPMIPRLLCLLLAVFLTGELTSPASTFAADGKNRIAAVEEDEVDAGNDNIVVVMAPMQEEESDSGLLLLYALIVLALLGGGWWGWGYYCGGDSDTGIGSF